ncbi:DUF2267 domain-containing protein [Streptomyces sp. NPDC006638]|uniref:DUF2267 domain-containing protein n=1 Tax=unclassified Streptomyces TaxID=2593676 RepID=UPI0033B898D5
MTRRESTQRAATTAYGQLLEKVRYDGVYPTRRRAEEALRAVVPVLGRQLTEQGRALLAARLPAEVSELLVAEASAPAVEPLTDRDFVEAVAARTGSSYAVACWDTETVLTNLATLTGPAFLPRLLGQLPSSYAPLFGQSSRAQAA